MKLKVYSVYDSKVSAYLRPFFMQATGQALRAWESTVNDVKSEFNQYPADFTLFEIAEFDESTGLMENYTTKKNLGTALEYIKRPEVLGKPQLVAGLE